MKGGGGGGQSVRSRPIKNFELARGMKKKSRIGNTAVYRGLNKIRRQQVESAP